MSMTNKKLNEEKTTRREELLAKRDAGTLTDAEKDELLGRKEG